VSIGLPWIRQLVAGLSELRPGFDQSSGRVSFVVEEVAVGEISLQINRSPLSESFHATSTPILSFVLLRNGRTNERILETFQTGRLFQKSGALYRKVPSLYTNTQFRQRPVFKD
jgi:hypothetical protein